MKTTYDVAVVGFGIVGLAHAYAAARTGARVIVIDRDEAASQASVRNFGFITVTGQAPGEMWSLARRTRDIWAVAAPAANIAVDQQGLTIVAHRPEAADVLEAFAKTDMGAECELLSQSAYGARHPNLPLAPIRAALLSPHELRVEPRTALPKLKTWLADQWQVAFRPQTNMHNFAPGRLETSSGPIYADHIFLCPGDNISGMCAETMIKRGVRRCKLQMLRLAGNGVPLPTPIMADLSLARYEGYTSLSAAAPLKKRLEGECPALLAAGIHLIVVEAGDGSLVVGDSHTYANTPDPFQYGEIDDLILSAFRETLANYPTRVIERWIGTYAWSSKQHWFCETVCDNVHLTVVTCGAGMSTAFAIGEQSVARQLNANPKALS